MFIEFKTKRDINGNRKYIAIDTDKKQYATMSRGWITIDVPEVKSNVYKTLLTNVRKENYSRKECL